MPSLCAAQVEDFLKEVNSKNSIEMEDDEGTNTTGSEPCGDLGDDFNFNDSPQINARPRRQPTSQPQQHQQTKHQDQDQPLGSMGTFPNEESPSQQSGTQSLVELGMSESLPPFEMIEEL
jgi:hypothetical protein